MAEAAHSEIHLAQPVEEEEPGLDGGMLELAFDEFERGERAYLEQPPAGVRARQHGTPLRCRERRRARFRRQDALDDRHELVVPAAQRLGIAPAEAGERRDGSLDVGPPLQCPPLAGDERDVELGFDQARAVPRQFEIGVPRHRAERAQKEGVGVVQEAGMARVFERAQSAAHDRRALDRKRLEAGLAEIGLQDQRVVAGAENDAVVGHHTTVWWRSMQMRSTSSGSRCHQRWDNISTSQWPR